MKLKLDRGTVTEQAASLCAYGRYRGQLTENPAGQDVPFTDAKQ